MPHHAEAAFKTLRPKSGHGDPMQVELLSESAVQDPHPVFDLLRREDPVHFYEAFDSWFLTRHQDVMRVLRDPRQFSSRRVEWLFDRLPHSVRKELREVQDGMALAFVFLDPPRHRVIRKHVADAFTPKFVQTLSLRVGRVVDEVFERALAQPTLDLVADIAEVVPTRVIAELFGVSPEDSRYFRRWARTLNRFMGLSESAPLEALHEIGSDIIAMGIYFVGLIQARRRKHQGDLLGLIVDSQRHDPAFSDAELLATCMMILFGGDEMVQNMIANTAMLVLTHKHVAERLAARREQLPVALEECLRFEPPGSSWGRIAVEDVEIAGKRIRKGDHVIVSYAAANRDPEVFSSPHELIFERSPNPHLSFSTGIHHCIGAALARMEGQLILGRLLDEATALTLTQTTPRFRADSLGLRSIVALPTAYDGKRKSS